MFTGLKANCSSILLVRKDTPHVAGCPLFLVLFCILLLAACSSGNSDNTDGDIDVPVYEGNSEVDTDAESTVFDSDSEDEVERTETLDGDKDIEDTEFDVEPDEREGAETEFDQEHDAEFDTDQEYGDDVLEMDNEPEDDAEDTTSPVCTPDLAYKYPGTWQYVYPYPYSTYYVTSPGSEIRKPVINGPGGLTMASGGWGRFVYLEDGQWRLVPNYIYSEINLPQHPIQNAVTPDGGPDSILDSGKVFTYREDGCWHADEALEAYPGIYEHRWVGSDLWAVQASERRILRKSSDGTVTEYQVGLYGDAFVYPTTITSCNSEPLAVGLSSGDYEQNVFLLELEGDTLQPRFIGKISDSEQAVPIEIFCNDTGITIVTENGDIFMSDAFPPDETWTSRSLFGPECVEDSLVTCSSMDEEGRTHIGLYSCEQNYQIFDGETQVFGLSSEAQTEFEERLRAIYGLRPTEDGLTTIAARDGIMNISTIDGSYETYVREQLPQTEGVIIPDGMMSVYFHRVDKRADGHLVAAIYYYQVFGGMTGENFFLMDYKDGCWTPAKEAYINGIDLYDMITLGDQVWLIGFIEKDTSEDPNGFTQGLFYYDENSGKWLERLEDEIGKNIDTPSTLDKIDDDSAIFLTSICCMPELMRMYRTDDGGQTWPDISPAIFDDPDLERGHWWGVWSMGEYLFGNGNSAYRLDQDGETTVLWRQAEGEEDPIKAIAAFKLKEDMYLVNFVHQLGYGPPGEMTIVPMSMPLRIEEQIGQLSSGDLIASAKDNHKIISISTDLEIRTEFVQPMFSLDSYSRMVNVIHGENGDDVYAANNGGAAPELYHLYAEGGQLDPARLKCSNYPPLTADGDQDGDAEAESEAP